MILICDDDSTIRSSLTLLLRRAGYESAAVEGPEQAVDFVRHTCPELIVMDMNYSRTISGEEGLELLAKVRIFCPAVPVILITAWGTIDLAVRGIRAGAFDFVTKPWNNTALLNRIQTAIQLTRSTASAPEKGDGSDSSLLKNFHRESIIGHSPALSRVLETLARISSTNASVLITGESGTGKELVAEAIHRNSTRKDAPFVKVNLGGISQSLFESEMFGHRKGAFTDAHYDRTGRFEMADKGTIFLDEIGDLDPMSQVKLLRVLQDQTFEALGDSRQRQVDTRIISATNRNLAEMVREGTFREDLFYRINLITVHMPSLRERLEDIPDLVEYFIRLRSGRPVGVSADAYAFLRTLPWPGNIRELKNLVDRTLLVSDKELLTEADFREHYVEFPTTATPSAAVHSLADTEREMIRRAIELYGGNHTKVAAALGLSRPALYRRLEKYGMHLPD